MKKNILIKLNDKTNVWDALKKLQKTSKKILFVTDKSGRLIGSINDGDIRRALLKGLTLSTKLKFVYNKKVYSIRKEKNREELVKIFKKKKITSIPFVSSEKKIKKIYFMDELLFFQKNSSFFKNDFDAVIMAGGFGKRLMPLTRNKPKCLVNITKSTKIIDAILIRLKKYGFKKIFFINHYKHNQICHYVEKKYSKTFDLKFIREKTPLGTAGGLNLLKNEKNISKSFLVINSDIISEINFKTLLEFHSTSKSLLTVVTKKLSQKLSFGSVKYKLENLLSIDEKPTISFFINAGIYLVSTKVLKYINPSKKIDMNSFIEKIKNKRKKIKIFHSYEDWYDVGTIEKLREVRKKYKNI